MSYKFCICSRGILIYFHGWLSQIFRFLSVVSLYSTWCVCVCTFVCAYSSHVLTICNAMDCSLPGSFLHQISQSIILEQVDISSSRGSSWPRDWTSISYISCIGKWILYNRATWAAPYYMDLYLIMAPFICSWTHISKLRLPKLKFLIFLLFWYWIRHVKLLSLNSTPCPQRIWSQSITELLHFCSPDVNCGGCWRKSIERENYNMYYSMCFIHKITRDFMNITSI